MKTLQESADPRSVAATDFFVYATTKYLGAHATVLAASYVIVFTAGVGAISALVCKALCRALAWPGVVQDDAANGPRVSPPDSWVSVWVIPTNKEPMIARHNLSLVRLPAPRELSFRDVGAL